MAKDYKDDKLVIRLCISLGARDIGSYVSEVHLFSL